MLCRRQALPHSVCAVVQLAAGHPQTNRGTVNRSRNPDNNQTEWPHVKKQHSVQWFRDPLRILLTHLFALVNCKPAEV